jgi:hypothetical protein
LHPGVSFWLHHFSEHDTGSPTPCTRRKPYKTC